MEVISKKLLKEVDKIKRKQFFETWELYKKRDSFSFGWKTVIRSTLWTVYQDCYEEGWNGYDANPITHQTIIAGETLLDLLPDDVMPPEVIPEPTGKVSFEWHNDFGAILVIALDSDSIAFAELIGSKKRYGETKFLSKLPEDMMKSLLSYFKRPF